MRRSLLISASFVFLILCSTIVAKGQSKWGMDVRPSLSLPTKYFSGTRLELGFGFDAMVTYNVVGNASVYAGWGWSLFPQNKTKSNAMSVEKIGSSFGLKYAHPLNRFNLEYYVKGGAIRQHINVETSSQKKYHSDYTWGWQIESGLSLPLDYGIALQPGLKYSTLGGTINLDGAHNAFDLDDLSAGIVLSIRFGKMR